MGDSSSMFSVLNYNIRSFQKNSDAFVPVIDKSLPSVLTLSETWFTDDFQAEIPNYNSYHSIRSFRNSGGISIYTHNSYNSKKIPELCYISENIEICTVEVKLGNDSMYVIGIYRPHSGTVDGFIHEIETVLCSPIISNRRCCLSGDFNINLILENSNTNRFIECLHSYHFYPVITKPTRFPPNNLCPPSLLDHIWYNSLNINFSGILSYDLTDHCPTFLQLPFLNSNSNKEKSNVKITFRVNNQTNRNIFRQAISDFDWATIVSTDINQYVKNFTDKLNQLYCSIFPVQTKFIPRHKVLNPWFTPALGELISQKSTYFDMFRLGAISKEENNRFKNKVKATIQKAKSLYYVNLFRANVNNARSTWKILNGLMNRTKNKDFLRTVLNDGVEFHDDKCIAEVFSDHFANIPIQLDSKIQNSGVDPLDFVDFNVLSPFVLDPCSSLECFTVIRNLKMTKNEKDSIPVKLFIANADILSEVVCGMINLCLTSSIFPNSLKIAKIIPIFKKDDPRLPSNYRPISILPFLSKIFEKVIYSRLINHLSLNEILSPYQFGFRKNISTLDAIIHITEFIYNALNNKNSILNILIDYSKAFDTVNHRILLRKLKRDGVTGIALKLFESYLQNRQQTVSIRNVCSNIKTFNISVPQGSILGPLLYLIYINEIPSLSQKFTATLFADDCVLSFCNPNLDNLLLDCTEELRIFKLWSDSNRLTINLEKTNCLFISNICSSLPDNGVSFSGCNLVSVSEAKFLGVTIDEGLKYNKHIQNICGKISKSIGIIYRVRTNSPQIPLVCLRQLYFSIIHPYILYCLPIFGSTYETHLNPLRLLQKRAIRIISKANYLDHSEPLFFLNKILKLDDIYKHSIACYVFKPPEILVLHRTSHNYETRNRDRYVLPYERLRISSQSVIHNSIKVWNEIPSNIKESYTFQGFKNKFKDYLLSAYAHDG